MASFCRSPIVLSKGRERVFKSDLQNTWHHLRRSSVGVSRPPSRCCATAVSWGPLRKAIEGT
eukprot:917404-Prorocentrum_minimum.AAC.4